MLLDDNDTPSNRELVEPMLVAATKGQELTQQLLAFSVQEPFEAVGLDLNGIVDGFQKMLRRLLREDVDIVYQLRNGRLPVRGDPRQLEQVLVNLAVNAQDAMPRGGQLLISTARVRVEADDVPPHPEMAAGEYALLSVQDSGVGISDETSERLFEPFFSTKSSGKATGLGLATVYGTVRRHGGVILVRSSVGEGATFTVILPIEVAPASTKLPVADVTPLGGDEQVWLVEDDQGVRDLALRLLEGAGYRAVAFATPEEAVDQLKSSERAHQPDLVVSDLVMPHMSGADLEVAFRAEGATAPFLLMSGYSGDAAGVGRRRMKDVLTKPFNRQSLLEAVRRALDRARLERVLPELASSVTQSQDLAGIP